MQNKDHRYLNTSQNLYSNHGYDYPAGNQHLSGEQYGNGSYPIPHNANPYGNNNLRGIPYDDNNHVPAARGHFIPPQDNSFINHSPDVNNERKNTAGNLNYESTYNMVPEHGSHSQVVSPSMVNMTSDNIHTSMPSNVNMVQPPHQPPGVNMVQAAPRQPNRQVHFPGQAPNTWGGQYQELHPRVQSMHHHNQQPPHFHTVSPNHVQQYPHETHTSNPSNAFPACNPALPTNNYQFRSVHPVAEGRNMSNPLQSLQNMVMSDNSVANMQQQNCQTPTNSNQCAMDYEKPASPYLNSDAYRASLACENKNSDESNTFYSQIPPPSSGETLAVPVTSVANENSLVVTGQVAEQYVEQQQQQPPCSDISQLGEISDSASPESANAPTSNHSSELSELSSNPTPCANEGSIEAHVPEVDLGVSATNQSTDRSDGEGQFVQDCIPSEEISLGSDVANSVVPTEHSAGHVDTQCKVENNSVELCHAEEDSAAIASTDHVTENVYIESETGDSECTDKVSDKTVPTKLLDASSIGEELRQALDVPSEACHDVSSGEVLLSCNQNEPFECPGEMLTGNREGNENCENTICTSVSPDAGGTGVLTVSSKALHKTVRAIKLRNLKRLKKTSQSNRKSFIAVPDPKNCEQEVAKNPVRVVIHRIRANSTNDTWHIPTSTEQVSKNQSKSVINGTTNKRAMKENISKSPQIIILSPAVSRKKASVKASSKPNARRRRTSTKTAPGNGTSVLAESHTGDPSDAGRESSEKSQNFPLKQTLPSPIKKQSRSRKSLTPKSKRKRVQRGKKKFQKIREDVKKVQKIKKVVKRFNGPYVRMIDSSNITVVNVAIRNEEKDKKSVQAKSAAESGYTKRPQVGHTSTLSPNYDAFNVDRTWTCVFCHKGSHTSGLGDLFGPYYVKESTAVEGTPTSSLKDSRSRCPSKRTNMKRKRSDVSNSELRKSSGKKLKQINKFPSDSQQHNVSPSVMDLERDMSESLEIEEEEGSSKKEIWIHEDCSVWCQTVSIVGQQVYGLEEAVQESRECICSVCKLNGATMGCWHKGCCEQYHFACAVQKDCQIDAEKFSLFCPEHKKEKSIERIKMKS